MPAVLTGPSLTVTLSTGTCAIVKKLNGDMHDPEDLLDDTLTCIGPELSYEKVCIFSALVQLPAELVGCASASGCGAVLEFTTHAATDGC